MNFSDLPVAQKDAAFFRKKQTENVSRTVNISGEGTRTLPHNARDRSVEKYSAISPQKMINIKQADARVNTDMIDKTTEAVKALNNFNTNLKILRSDNEPAGNTFDAKI